jgi:tetratricopeptide (TPR) repeat protein
MANDWYYKNANGTESGPLSAADLKQLAQTGQIDQETLIKKGGGSWVKASQIKGIPIAEPKIQAPKIIPPPLPKTEAEIVEVEEAEEIEYTKPKKKPKRTNQNNQTKESSFGWIKFLLAAGILLIILISSGVAWIILSRNEKWVDLYNKGLKATENLKKDDAIQNFTDAINLNQKYRDAYMARGDLYAEKKEYAKAIDDYTMSIELKNDDFRAYFRRGEIHAFKNNSQSAIIDFTKSILLKKDFHKAYLSRGIEYLNTDNPKKALEDFDFLINSNNYDNKTHLLRGDAYIKLGEREKGMNDYDLIIKRNPKNDTAYVHRAKGQTNLQNAWFDLTKAIEINPNNEEALLERAYNYMARRLPQKSIDDLTKAISLNNQNPRYYHIRGKILESIGNKSDAQDDFLKEKELINKKK